MLQMRLRTFKAQLVDALRSNRRRVSVDVLKGPSSRLQSLIGTRTPDLGDDTRVISES
jgi:hypothetical protein